MTADAAAVPTDEPVILLTDEVPEEPMGYDPRHLSADMLSLKLRMSAPGTTEQRALLDERRRRRVRCERVGREED